MDSQIKTSSTEGQTRQAEELKQTYPVSYETGSMNLLFSPTFWYLIDPKYPLSTEQERLMKLSLFF